MPTTAPRSTEADDLGMLRQLNDQFIRAVASSDATWFERHLRADFVNSNPDGTLSERAAFIQRVAHASPVTQLGAEDVRIRLFGQTALVHGRTTYRKPDGQPGAGRYTDVWARVDGQWLCAAADVTRC